MKKLIVGAIFLFVFSVYSLPVYAAGNPTLSFKQDSYSPKVGETFDVTLRINPDEEQINTVRAVFIFDPTVLRAEWASLSGPLDRSAPGNYLDNEKGVVSWAGFSIKSPLLSEVDFAKVTFTAVKEGASELKISTDSHLIADGIEKSVGAKSFGKSVVVTVSPAATETNGGIFVVNSPSHSAEMNWYKNNEVVLEWSEIESDNSIKSYFYTFDETPNTDPRTTVSSKQKTFQQKNVSEGVHYFHLKAVRKDGTFTDTIHRKVQVDTVVPNKIILSAITDRVLEGESVWLSFATTDETSGVVQYQVSMNDSVFQTQESPLEITDLKPSTYFFRVAALDRAGNSIYGSTSVRVYPKGTNLNRPTGFASGEEVKTLLQGGKGSFKKTFAERFLDDEKKSTLLIVLLLVVALIFGTIYAMKFKKRS